MSTGQVTPDERPAFGRSYQTPFADRIRNQAGIPTMAVGIISSYDDVNSLLLAGRADLCALGRAHLYDPNWTLHAAAEQDYAGPGAVWPQPWQAGAPAAADRPARRAETAAGPDPPGPPRHGAPALGAWLSHGGQRPQFHDRGEFMVTGDHKLTAIMVGLTGGRAGRWPAVSGLASGAGAAR